MQDKRHCVGLTRARIRDGSDVRDEGRQCEGDWDDWDVFEWLHRQVVERNVRFVE